MSIDRRHLLKTSAALSNGLLLPGALRAQILAPNPDAWRTFEVVTNLEIGKPEGKAQAWIPIPAVHEADWIRPLGNTWKTEAKAAVSRDPRFGAEMLHVEWADGDPADVEVTSRVATRSRAIDLSMPDTAGALSDAERRRYTAATTLIPTDGIVKETSDRITTGARTDLEKAKAVYEWIVDNTYRNAKTRGCGDGDIVALLSSGDLGGKCADLNGLYVGLMRAANIAARDVYGIRVAVSKFGYKSLGANSGVITKAQHCRAEVYLNGFGWVPVDPADVRKVVLEEPPTNLALDDPKVVAARKALFGAWEMNWIAYNFAQDVVLPGARGPLVGFLMYPQAETAAGRLDCLDPDKFHYTITARELAA
jgi:transglutaminase-like putative cysteine protease